MWQLIREIRLSRRRTERRKPGSPVHRIGLIAGAVVLTMLLGGRAHATEWVVTYDGDPGGDSLRDRIEMANNNPGADTIVFDESLSGKTIQLTAGALHITDDLTITGPGRELLTIDGGGTDRIFVVDGTAKVDLKVDISGMKLTAGHTPDGEKEGGAIVSWLSDLTLTDMAITGNAADGDIRSDYGDGKGGGVFVVAGKLTIRDSEISNNTAGQPGDGITRSVASGGGVSSFDADVAIYSSTISGNTAYLLEIHPFGGGGGIFAEQGSLALEKCTVSGNIVGNTADNETAFGVGGGVRSADADLTILQSTISNNLAGNSGSASEEAWGFGGGVSQTGGSATIVNTTVSGNVAGNSSGAVSLGFSLAVGGGLDLPNLSQVESSTIVGNVVNGDNSQGGGIQTAEDEDPVLLHNTIVAGNNATVGPDLFGLYEASYTLVRNSSDAILNGNLMVITGSDPQLGSLTDNGGPTETHAIPDTSPAYNAGDPVDCPATDQRGVDRPQAGVCDMGAFELASPLGGLLAAFKGYVDSGELKGNGPGNSGKNRLSAMGNKLATADALAAQGDIAGACDELASTLLKTDGQPNPPDFVKGSAVSLLAGDIIQTQTDLGCE